MRVKIVKISQFNPRVTAEDGLTFKDFEPGGECAFWRGVSYLSPSLPEIVEVDENDTPRISEVWLRADGNGVLDTWKYNYDSSG
jgi:hypothetical protein